MRSAPLLLFATLSGCWSPSEFHATVGRGVGTFESPNGREWGMEENRGSIGLTWDLPGKRPLALPSPPAELEPDPLPERDIEPTRSGHDMEALAGLIALLISTVGGAWAYNRRKRPPTQEG